MPEKLINVNFVDSLNSLNTLKMYLNKTVNAHEKLIKSIINDFTKHKMLFNYFLFLIYWILVKQNDRFMTSLSIKCILLKQIL